MHGLVVAANLLTPSQEWRETMPGFPPGIEGKKGFLLMERKRGFPPTMERKNGLPPGLESRRDFCSFPIAR
jgi:hypothetical protein